MLTLRFEILFKVLNTDSESNARRGQLKTAHGNVETPIFMPVGTQGTVKSVSPHELKDLEAQIVLGNTYHLFVRPGLEIIKEMLDFIQVDQGAFKLFHIDR